MSVYDSDDAQVALSGGNIYSIKVVPLSRGTWVEPSNSSLSQSTKSKWTPRKFILFCGSFFCESDRRHKQSHN